MHRIPDKLEPYPIGWRAKLGLLVPSHDTGYGSYEYLVMAPDGVVPLETRIPGRSVGIEDFRSLADGAVAAADMLSDARPDIIDFIPTAPCFVMGAQRERDLVSEIADKTGILSTSGGQSVIDALRFVESDRVVMYTPYTAEVQQLTNGYFGDQGIEVLGSRNLSFVDAASINRVSPYEILSDIVALTREHPEADGVFVVGGCFRTLEIVARLEEIIGIPVVGTQQANMFNCLRLTGVDDELCGFGRLLDSPRPVP